MASRSKKKRVSVENKPVFSKEYTEAKAKNQKLMASLPFVLIVALLLITICFFLPLTGLTISVDPAELMGGSSSSTPDPSTPNQPQQNSEVNNTERFTSSVSSFTIMFSPITNGDWIDLLSRNLLKDADDDFKTIIVNMISDKMSSTQRTLVDNIMWMQFVLSIILVACWLITIIYSAIALTKHKTIFPIVVLALIMALLSVVEFLTLFIVAMGGMGGASFVMNVGAYILPIITLALAIYVTKLYFDTRKYNKLIKKEEKAIEEMSSL